MLIKQKKVMVLRDLQIADRATGGESHYDGQEWMIYDSYDEHRMNLTLVMVEKSGIGCGG